MQLGPVTECLLGRRRGLSCQGRRAEVLKSWARLGFSDVVFHILLCFADPRNAALIWTCVRLVPYAATKEGRVESARERGAGGKVRVQVRVRAS